MRLKKYFNIAVDILITTFKEWIDDKAFRMAAALSFYSLMSLAPFMWIMIAAAGMVYGQQAVTGQLATRMDDYIGSPSADFIQTLISNAYVPGSEMIATVFGLSVFVWAALAVFVEIRDSLNTIWGVEVKPGKGVLEFFLSRFFSLLIILAMGLIFILSLVTGTLLNMADAFLSDFVFDFIPLLQWIEFFVLFTLITLLSAIVMKYLPSAKIEWPYILTGAILISILFNFGKYTIGYFLGKTNYSSAYGTAGTLVILLFWIYYSSLIFFFGAELTQVIRKKLSRNPLNVDNSVLRVIKIAEQLNASPSKS